MSSDEETPSFRARESARRSSGSRRMVVTRFDAIQAIYIVQASMEMGRRTDNRVCFEFSLRGWCLRGWCGAQPRLGLPTLGATAEGLEWTEYFAIGPDPRLFALWLHAAGKVRRDRLGTVARGRNRVTTQVVAWPQLHEDARRLS